MAKKSNFDYDVIVIGSGAGGSLAAIISAQSGKNVALVESGQFGGESPNWGDVPMKALLHATQLFDEARHGARFGIRSSTLGYNFPSIMSWKDLAIKRTGVNNNRAYYEQQGISIHHGAAYFLSPHEITVNRRHLTAEKFVIATGTHWEAPAIIGLDTINYLTPRTVLDLKRPPKTVYIIGGGPIGVEIAQFLSTLGTKVYLAEIAERLLPNEDAEAGQLLERVFRELKGITSLTHTRTLTVAKKGTGVHVTYQRGETEKSLYVDEVIIATGRTPNTDLGLENAAVTYSKHGIDVNQFLQTTSKHIYAAGDVLRREKYTNAALLESRLVAHNLFARDKNTPSYAGMPHVVFTFPGIASVGLSEDDCLRRDLHINKALAPLNIIARSNTSDFRDGFVKIIADKKGVVVGATVVAPHASEIIHELALAVRYELTAAELAAMPHAFLSWSEAVRVAAAKLT